jgi:hypothetical protein
LADKKNKKKTKKKKKQRTSSFSMAGGRGKEHVSIGKLTAEAPSYPLCPHERTPKGYEDEWVALVGRDASGSARGPTGQMEE